MIRYHGAPVTPLTAARDLWTCRHALVSFANSGQAELAAEVSQSFVLDNGAFTAWQQGEAVDVPAYADWCDHWLHHPGCDWCLIPDVIDGDEADNDELLKEWRGRCAWYLDRSVPVFHMHESLSRLIGLVQSSWDRIAIGSSGEFATPGSDAWWRRMVEIMGIVCDADGRPRKKLHGLRMMDPTIFSHVPFSSVDSCGVARNVNLDSKWTGPYAPRSSAIRAVVLADRFERHASASRWSGSKGMQMNLELAG